MAQPLRMHQIKRVIELQRQGRSIRETVKLTGLSRNMVREYLRRRSESGLGFSDLLSLMNVLLAQLLAVFTEGVYKLYVL